MKAKGGGGRGMNRRERDIVRYAMAYLTERDGRKARSHTAGHLSPQTTREIRAIVNKMWNRARGR